VLPSPADHHVAHHPIGSAGRPSGNPHLLRLRERERVHGGRVQDLRGAPEATQPEHPDHHLRHQPAVRLHRHPDGHQLHGVPEEHQHLCPLQQGLDQGEDLCAAAPGGL